MCMNISAHVSSIQYTVYPVYYTVPLYKCNKGFIYLRSLVIDWCSLFKQQSCFCISLCPFVRRLLILSILTSYHLTFQLFFVRLSFCLLAFGSLNVRCIKKFQIIILLFCSSIDQLSDGYLIFNVRGNLGLQDKKYFWRSKNFVLENNNFQVT